MTCAIPPLDQSLVRVGRGYGIGFDRSRSTTDQLHGGMDFPADAGSVVVAPLDGQVVLVSSNDGPLITATQAKAGEVGQVRGFGGYGNVVVLRHSAQIPGMPAVFWTSYNHLQRTADLRPGQTVRRGDRIGYVGNTTNNRFSGMGAHLHFEVRRREPPGSYDRDTIDPALLFTSTGIDWVEKRPEASGRGRFVDGRLLIRAGSASDPAVCSRRSGVADLSRLEATFEESVSGLSDVPPGYVDPATLRTAYTSKGATSTTQTPRVTAPELDPPDYPSASGESTGGGGGGGGGMLAIGVAALGAFWLSRR